MDHYTEILRKLSLIEMGVYQICKSLIYIVDTECCTYGQDESVKMAEEYIEAYEKDHPELEQEPKTGRWIVTDADIVKGSDICECSECGGRIWKNKDAEDTWNYCPTCGAKMKGGE